MSYQVVGLGEVLWDMLPTGKKLGGAPANFAYHARALGANATILSRVGDDPLGRELISELAKLGVPNCDISLDPAHPTGTVDVELAPDGQPSYIIHREVAWDHLIADSDSMLIAEAADAICFGSLAQRSPASRSAIRALISASKPHAFRIFDINLRQNFYTRDVIDDSLQLANVFKLNDSELPILARLLALSGKSDREQLAQLAQQYELRLIAFTRGERGSLLFRDGEWSEHPGVATQVRDTVGAGDSFTAAVPMGLLLGWPLDRINETANEIAAFVCSQSGGTPPLPEHLRRPFEPVSKSS
jgi:fructokinase